MTLIAGSSGGSLVKEVSPGNYYLIGVTHGSGARTSIGTSDKYPGLFVSTQYQENQDFINQWISQGDPNSDSILYFD